MACPAVLLKKKKKAKSFVAFGVADPYLHNASRTNKTSSSGIVREAQREASTDMIFFFLSFFVSLFLFFFTKATRTVEGVQVILMEEEGERGFSLMAGKTLQRDVAKSEHRIKTK